MSDIVVINLADPGGFGAVSRMVPGLRVKHDDVDGTLVSSFELFETLKALKDGDDLKDDETLKAAALACSSSKKIYLCTHGTATDTDNAFAKASGGASLATYRELGRLLRRLFQDKTKAYNLALVMCFGARTTTFRARDLDHNGMIPESILKTSFAFKLFRYLCENGRDVRMTARTGAVAFSEKTGASSVQQEVAIDLALDKEEYLRSPAFDGPNQAYIALRGGIASDKDAAKFVKEDSKYKADPMKRLGLFASASEKTHSAYRRALARRDAIQRQIETHPDMEKYGKIVYTWDGSTLTIINKYGSINTGLPTGATLYSGPML